MHNVITIIIIKYFKYSSLVIKLENQSKFIEKCDNYSVAHPENCSGGAEFWIHPQTTEILQKNYTAKRGKNCLTKLDSQGEASTLLLWKRHCSYLENYYKFSAYRKVVDRAVNVMLNLNNYESLKRGRRNKPIADQKAIKGKFFWFRSVQISYYYVVLV